MPNRGPAAGVVAGILALQSGQQFTGRVYAWSRTYTIGQRSRAGRGGPRFAQTRRLNAGSVISFRMQGTGEGYPAPLNIYDAAGTVTIQYDDGKKVVLTGDIVKYEEAFGQGKNKEGPQPGENWDIGVVMNLTIAPTYTGWPGTQTTPTVPTPADQETDEGLSRTIDPNVLETKAARAWDVGTIADTISAETAKLTHFLTSAAPTTTLKVVTGTLVRTDRAGVKVRVGYAQRDTADNENFPSTNSHRSNVNPFTDDFGALTNDTRSVATVSNSLMSAYRNVDYFRGVTVRPKTDGIKKLVFHYVNPGVLVSFNVRSGARAVKSRISGGNPQLLVTQLFSYSATRAAIYLSAVDDLTAEINDFTVYRQVRGTTIPKSNPDTIGGATLPFIGNTNSDSFLGYSAGNVQYAGPRGKVNIGLSLGGTATFVMFMAYAFHASSLGIVTGVPRQIFGTRLIKSFSSGTLAAIVAALASGDGVWVNASSLGYPGVVAPTQASFAAFTTWSPP